MPPRHARGEVAAGRPEDDDRATGHVLAAVVAHALDDRGRAGVADAEPLADAAAEERPRRTWRHRRSRCRR